MIEVLYDKGKTKQFNKINMFRKGKKAAKWYFADKFAFTLNILGLIWLVL